MNIGVVIVTYNRIEKLKKALMCYEKQILRPAYMLVVDNASTDGTREYLESWKAENSDYKKFIITMTYNTGGAGGFYVGMEKALELSAEWIWLADDDAYPRTDTLNKLSEYYEALDSDEKSDISAVCSAVYNFGKIHFAHRNYLEVTAFKVKMTKSALEDYEKEAFDFDILSYVGSCIRKDALLKAGLVEKNYFIYRDDQEHSIRIKKTGRLVCVTGSIVDHDTPPFDAEDINWGKFYFKRNDFLMIRKHFPIYFFLFRIVKRGIQDISFLSKNSKELKKMYCYAYKEAVMNRQGINKIYKPGWKPESKKSGKE